MAFLAVVAKRSGDSAGIDQQAQHRTLHVDFHAGVNAVILQGADHFEAGAVAHVREAGIAVAAEVALQDASVFGAVEERAPCFQFVNARGRFFRVKLSHSPVVEVLAAAHSVREVDAPVIAIVHVTHGGGYTAFSHDGVGFAKKGLTNDTYLEPCRRGLDRGAQTGAARSNDQYVIGVSPVLGHLKNSPVGPDTHGAEPDVDIGEAYREQARPGPLLVVGVKTA